MFEGNQTIRSTNGNFRICHCSLKHKSSVYTGVPVNSPQLGMQAAGVCQRCSWLWFKVGRGPLVMSSEEQMLVCVDLFESLLVPVDLTLICIINILCTLLPSQSWACLVPGYMGHHPLNLVP